MIGSDLQTGLDAATKEMRHAVDAWDGVRDAELAAHPWVFALRRTELPASSFEPLFGFEYSYPVPVDCLRVIDLPCLDRRQWMVEDSGETGSEVKSILTRWNGGEVIDVRYIARIETVGKWSPWFCKAMAAKLAMDLCEVITQNNSKLDVAASRYQDAIRTAMRTDAIELPPQQSPVDDWILARR